MAKQAADKAHGPPATPSALKDYLGTATSCCAIGRYGGVRTAVQRLANLLGTAT